MQKSSQILESLDLHPPGELGDLKKNTVRPYICNHCRKRFSIQDLGENYDPVKQSCKDCFEKHEEKKRATIRQQRLDAYNAHLRTLPKKYHRQEPDKKTLAEAEGYAGGSVFFTGEAGAGKTYMACLIAKILWKDGRKAKFVSYPDLIFAVQTRYDSAEEKLQAVKNFTGTLILDDFGADKLTEFARLFTYLVINHREANELPTIITSNYDLATISTQIDDRIASRINGMCQIVKYKGDRRARKMDK